MLNLIGGDKLGLLFNKEVFIHGEVCDEKFVPIGKEIVKKCALEKRLYVQESELWNGILAALRLSYTHFPSHLKGCLAYCSIFPKNYVIKKKNLIFMWIAQGLIQSAEGGKPLEDIGEEYFKELMWIFFLRLSKGVVMVM